MRNSLHWRRYLKALLILILLAFLLPQKAGAESVTDTITICVGYFGGPYYEKCTYTWQQLDDFVGGALDSHQIAYSYYSGARTAIDSARGFLLSDLLEYSGVDINSISTLSFYTKDQAVGAFATFSKSALLDSARYFFPNIGTDEDEQLVALNGGDLTDGAVRVETMLALEDTWEWDAVDSNFASLNPSSRFRLVFGQTDPAEKRTNQSAKYVHTVYVTFSGKPVLSADADNLDMKVGSNYSVNLNIATADSVLDQSLSGSLEWSSSDESVVTVDAGGNLTAVGPGTAVITVTSGETTLSVTVAVSDEDGGGGGAGDGTGGGTGSGIGSGIGSGTEAAGAATGAGETDAPETETSLTPAGASPEPADDGPDVQPEVIDSAPNAYILSGALMTREEYAAWVQSILHPPEQDASDGGSAGGGAPMADDAEQLILKEITPPKFLPAVVTGVCGILFLLGGAFGTLKYRYQLKR